MNKHGFKHKQKVIILDRSQEHIYPRNIYEGEIYQLLDGDFRVKMKPLGDRGHMQTGYELDFFLQEPDYKVLDKKMYETLYV